MGRAEPIIFTHRITLSFCSQMNLLYIGFSHPHTSFIPAMIRERFLQVISLSGVWAWWGKPPDKLGKHKADETATSDPAEQETDLQKSSSCCGFIFPKGRHLHWKHLHWSPHSFSGRRRATFRVDEAVWWVDMRQLMRTFLLISMTSCTWLFYPPNSKTLCKVVSRSTDTILIS